MYNDYYSSLYTGIVNIGKKTYKIDLTQDSLFDKFNKKVFVYPDGKTREVYANQRVFAIPGYKLQYQFETDLDIKRRINRADPSEDSSEETKSESEYRGKRYDNLQRARARMQHIVLCNHWDYFVTFTFNDTIVDASSVADVRKKVQKWLSNQVNRKGIGYLLVPEYHKKDHRIHLHALISGKGLDLEFSGTYGVDGFKKPLKESTIRRKHLQDRILYKVYNVTSFKFGFTTAIDVYGDVNTISNYILKYMTKDCQKIFGHSYWVSRNLELFPIVELSNVADYYKIRSKEYAHGITDTRYKYVSHLGTSIDDEKD